MKDYLRLLSRLIAWSLILAVSTKIGGFESAVLVGLAIILAKITKELS